MNTSKNGIAIVGLDCRFPGADDHGQFWENILALRQSFRNIPKKRVNLDYYGSDDKNSVDHTYSKKAAVLTGYHFDRVKYRVAKSTFEQTDMAHWLTLDTAAGALKDAGFENGVGLDKTRVGVIIGNSLNGEFSRASVMRLRWPYVAKVFESALRSSGMLDNDIVAILSNAETIYKNPFPIPDPDTLAGGLANTIAGRICNHFDFNAGGFTVDGACASSLLAIATGCTGIIGGELDVAIVGGVDLSIDPFELVGFARNGALATTDMEVYNAKSQGFWPGEGCGIAILMREDEALVRGLNIYSVIKGWGITSDGKGGITRPKLETQSAAISRAYERAGYGIETVAYFEGHGTGTPLGDEIEMGAIVHCLKGAGKSGGPAVLGSVKHLIGHTKAAAGVASIIKASMALKNRVLPHSRPTNSPHSFLTQNADLLKLGKELMPWASEKPMRASVSAMGFGGINVHVTLEEPKTSRKSKNLSGKQRQLANSYRTHEIFPVSGTSRESLNNALKRLAALARDMSRAEFIDVSVACCNRYQDGGCWRASVVARTPDELLEGLNLLVLTVEKGDESVVNIEKRIYFSSGPNTKKLAFLFPGQGSPLYKDFGAFCNLPIDVANTKFTTGHDSSDSIDTSIAQPVITENSMKSVEFLYRLGIDADLAIGHSLGELAALNWGGGISDDDTIWLAKERGKAMSELGDKFGSMLALRCSESQLQELVEGKNVHITNYNGHNNYVVGGHRNNIRAVQQEAFQKEIKNVELRVSHAFHTPMMHEAALHFKNAISKVPFSTPHKCVVSTVTGDTIGAPFHLDDHLYKQIERPVLFTHAIEKVKDDVSFFIEVGPGEALTKSLISHEGVAVIALDFCGASLSGLMNIMSAAFISGRLVRFDELNVGRFYRPIDIDAWSLDVLVNPCEKMDHQASLIQKSVSDIKTETSKSENTIHMEREDASDSLEGVIAFAKRLISEKVEIAVEVLGDEDKLSSQLHLNSLAITEIVSLITKKFIRSHKTFSAASIIANADGSIRAVAEQIYEGSKGRGDGVFKEQVSFDLVHNWTQIFKRINVIKKLPRLVVDNGHGKINIYGNWEGSVDLQRAVDSSSNRLGNGSLFVSHSEDADKELPLFLEFLQKNTVRNANFVALVSVQSGTKSGDLKPLLRSFQLEMPQITVFSVELDVNCNDIIEKIIAELGFASKYREVVYLPNNARYESECELFLPVSDLAVQTLNQNDVLLVTGGGKGITFEAALSLATHTGVKLAIFGRSIPEDDKGLSGNLEMLVNSGVNVRYYSVNVCNEDDVRKALTHVENELGVITAYIHGAGINNPKLIADLLIDDFTNTSRVKVEGAKNVFRHLNPEKLRFLIGYGSIIAESGMNGNADYAWANDQLALFIEQQAENYPGIRCMTLEWSVWDGTGMGVSLNSIASLKERGVYPIPVKSGVAILNQLMFSKNSGSGRYMISGRYGSIPTLMYTKPRLPTGRFIFQVKNIVPGVEAVSDVSVNLQDDIYLSHHVFQNQYVFPTVMALEGMAQVCHLVSGKSGSIIFKNLNIHKPIFVPEKTSNMLRIIATRIDDNRFGVVVQSEDSNFEVNCFEAELTYGDATFYQNLDTKYFGDMNDLSIDVERKFYDDLLFHGGGFRRIKSFKKIHALESIAIAEINDADQWFGMFLPDHCLLGDPGLNDAAIHCHQACRPECNILPTGASEVYINGEDLTGPFYIRTSEKMAVDNDIIIDVVVVNQQGLVKIAWSDLCLTKVSGTQFKGTWDKYLLLPYLEHKIKELSGNTKVSLNLDILYECLTKNDAIEIQVDMSTPNVLLSSIAACASLSDIACDHWCSLDGKDKRYGSNIRMPEKVVSIEVQVVT